MTDAERPDLVNAATEEARPGTRRRLMLVPSAR